MDELEEAAKEPPNPKKKEGTDLGQHLCYYFELSLPAPLVCRIQSGVNHLHVLTLGAMDGITKAVKCLMMAMTASETKNPKLLTLKGCFIIEALAWFTWGTYKI